jgi:hypothetical protein
MEPSPHDLSIQTEAVLKELQTDIATVMGPAMAGTPDSQQLQDILSKVGPPPARSASAQEKAAYMKKMTDSMKDMMQQAFAAAQQKTTQAVTLKMKDVQDAVNATVTQCEQDLLQAKTLNTTDGGDNSTNKAADTFTASIDSVTSLMKLVDAQDTRLKTVNLKINMAYSALNPDGTGDTETIDKQNTLRRNIQQQHTTLQREIISLYDSAFRQTKSKTTLLDLNIPKDVHTGKGQQVIESMNAYLRGRAGEYYAIIPYLNRISEDFNAAEGIYWQPPARRNKGYDKVNNTMRKAYADQSYTLYHIIKGQLSTETLNRISSTYKYGMYEQKEDRCEHGDGPSAYFALISLYKPIKAAHRDTLTEEFNTAWQYFTKGDPRKKIKHLRPKLVEAIQLEMQLNWSTTGKKIVQVLSRSDHVMAQELKQFEKGPVRPEDTNVYLQNLFAAIEAESDKATLTYPGEKKEWHASYVGADDRRPCRYGAECTDTICTRSHPHGHKRPRSNNNGGKGKGKGGNGKGKGDNDKGKGKGKGRGRGSRPACEAEGCSQNTPHPSKALCTTCFKKVLDTGSIKKKDGTTFEFKGKNGDSQDKQDKQTNNAYGFSAEQIEGLRHMQQASAYLAEGIEADERPGPASVKRARIAERIGKRADAADVSERTANFLTAINRN